MLRKCFFIFTMLIFVLLSKSPKVNGQTISPDNNCEFNLSLLDSIRSLPLKDTQIIVIAYRSKNENSIKYSLKRLEATKIVLGDKTTVFAIGEKLVSKPKVEIYVNGKLDLVLETKSRERLRTQLCGLLY